MIYDEVTLINRTGKTVEWYVGGMRWEMKAGETRPFKSADERFAAYHALNETNTGLEEYTEKIELEEAKKAKSEMPDYSQMKWQKLVSMAGKKFKPSMNKNDVVKLLEERWKARHEEK